MKWPKPAASPSVKTFSEQEASGNTPVDEGLCLVCLTMCWCRLIKQHLFLTHWACICQSKCFLLALTSIYFLCSLVVNVMQRDSIPSEVDYETRQGVYSICLQLARFKMPQSATHVKGVYCGSVCWNSCVCRFLLVGQSMPVALDDDITRDGDTLSSRPFRNAGRTGRQLSLCGTPEKSSYRQMSLSERSSIRVEEIIPAARVAIQVFWTNTRSLPGIRPSKSSVHSPHRSTYISSLDHGSKWFHFHCGLFHASDLGSCSRTVRSGWQPAANQRDPQLPFAAGSAHQSQQYRWLLLISVCVSVRCLSSSSCGLSQ